MDASHASKSGSFLVVAATAVLLLSGLSGTAWAAPPPLGSACTIEGTAGPDVLNGTAGADVICGYAGDDVINGLGGDDLIIGGAGNDTIDGGPGDDDVYGGAGDDTIVGGGGNDRLYGDGGNDDVSGSAGADLVAGGVGDDVLDGGLDADEVYGQAGVDQVMGGAGDDKVDGGSGDDDVRGNTGADRVRGNAGNDHIYGGDDNDVLRGGDGDDHLYGGPGDDALHDRDGAGFVDGAHCGDGTDVANIDSFDTADPDCEDTNVLDREDPVAVDDAKTVNEDVGPRKIEVLANDTDADGGPIRVASVTQPANGTVTIAASKKRVFYTPDADYCNTPPGTTPDTFDYTLAPGGSTATVSVKVACRPDVPVAVDDAPTLVEDDPATTIDVLANDTDVTVGTTITSVTQPANGTVVITNAGADLTYQPDADYCNDGTPTDDFTYTLDPGADTGTVAVTVTCVDDAPVAVDDTAAVAEDDPATTVDVLANDSDADGDAFTIDQVTQPANGTVVITNAGADLTYQPDADYCNDGTPTDDFTYTLTPGGDTATVAVTVTCVGDPPVAEDDTETVTEDDPATTIDVLGNDSDADGDAFTVDQVTQPANGTVVITNAGADLTYQPDADYCNDPPATTLDTFTYTLDPDGDTATVTVTVTCVNDAPVADDETFSGASAAVGNTVLVHNDTTDGAPSESGPHKTITGDLLDGDTDVDSAGPLTITAETVASVDGGSAVIEADGDFVYTPAAGTSCTDTTDSFDYTVNDGDGGSGVGTVTIEIAGCVWYVDNTAAADGGGTSSAPFDTLSEAEAASATTHTIFVFDGNGTSTGYGGDGLVLKSGQRLIGEHTGLQVGSDPLHPANPGAHPTLTATDADVVSLDDDNVLRGLNIDPSGTGGGIAGGSGDNNGTIADVNISDGGTAGTQPGLELDATTGTFAVSDLTVSTSGATGIRLNNAGTVNFAGAGTVSVTTTGAKALDLTGTNLGTSVFDAVTVTGSGAGGVSATSTTGSLTFGDLALTTTSGSAPAFALTNAAAVTVPASGTATISATGGPAVDVQGSAATLDFDTVSSANSATRGVNLQSFGTGTFSAAAGTISGNQVGPAFETQVGSGDITYAGTIQDGAGGFSAAVISRSGGTVTFSGNVTDGADSAGGIFLTNNTGGTTVFSGSTKAFDTGNQPGVQMTNSNGHTLRFTGGGLSITTTTARGFDADNSGTAVVQGTGNTITSTAGGRALSVVTTDIGADDLTFQSISATGAGSQGIVLDTTGSAGNLVVTGSGGTCTNGFEGGCSGGTIQNTTGADSSAAVPGGTGIVLNNTAAPSFTRMWIKDHSNYGVRGTNVAGFTMANSVVNGANGTSDVTDDSSLYFTGLTGSASVTDTYVSGGFENNMAVINTSGALDRITLTNSTFGVSGSRPANDALLLEAEPSAGALKATITGTTFSSAAGDLFNFIHQGTAAGDLVLSGNTFTNSHPAIATGGGGVTMVTGATTTMAVSNNTLRDAVGPGFLIAKLAGSSTQSGTFSNNTVGASGVANSGSAEGSTLKLQNVGGGTSTWAVTGNQVFGYNNFGIEVLAGGGSTAQSGAINATITGNTVAQPGNTAGTITIPKQGVHLNIGTVPGDTFQVCAAVTGNTIHESGADAVPVTGVNVDVRLRQRQATTIRLPGYAGANNDANAVQNFVNANNSASTTTLAQHTVPTGGGYVGGAACPTP